MQAPSQATTSTGAHRASVAERLDGGFDHARRQAPPARMRRGDGATVRCRQQHRQAIGGLDDASDARLAGDDGIGFVDRRARRGVGGADADDARAVDLAQEDRRCAHRLAQQRPVRADGAGVVADRGADVHRRVGSAR